MKVADIALPFSNLYLEGSNYDKNGNKVVKIGISSMNRAFSIQTLGNLQLTHSILSGKKSKKDMMSLSSDELVIISKEVISYIKEYGNPNQKDKLREYNS